MSPKLERLTANFFDKVIGETDNIEQLTALIDKYTELQRIAAKQKNYEELVEYTA